MAYHVTPSDARDRARVSTYVIKRVGAGIPGLPAHPKKTDKINLELVARESGVDYAVVRKMKPHLLSLVVKHGLQDPVAANRAAAADIIRSYYGDRPVPMRKTNFHKAQLALDTGVSVPLLDSGECRAAIREAIQKSGSFRVTNDLAAEIAALAAYRGRLLAEGRKVPWQSGYDRPDIAKIMMETGLFRHRLEGELADALHQLIDEVGHEPTLDFAAETALLTAYVDRMIRENVAPPSLGAKGVNYAQISRDVGITAHRLHTYATMRAQIDRWSNAFAKIPANPAPDFNAQQKG